MWQIGLYISKVFHKFYFFVSWELLIKVLLSNLATFAPTCRTTGLSKDVSLPAAYKVAVITYLRDLFSFLPFQLFLTCNEYCFIIFLTAWICWDAKLNCASPIENWEPEGIAFNEVRPFAFYSFYSFKKYRHIISKLF